MSAERLEKLIESYLNDTLSESEWAELNGELEKSGESRDRLREMVGTHQDLSELYSIRAPILPLELDSPVASVSAVPQRKGIFWMAVLYGILLVGFLGLLFFNLQKANQKPLAQIVSSDTLDRQPLMAGPFSLDTGMAEIEMRSGARFALEGGTSVRLIDVGKIRLVDGKIGVQVPVRAKGFTVETKYGNFVDLGTRFGVMVDHEAEAVESQLFEGRIEVHAGSQIKKFNNQAVVRLTADDVAPIAVVDAQVDPLKFPMPRVVEIIPIVKGDFEPGDDYVIADSKDVPIGRWGGNFAKIVTHTDGIKPFEGKGMLKLLSSSQHAQASDKRFCDVVQGVDLSGYVTNKARFTARSRINRVEGDETTDTLFMLEISAYSTLDGDPLVNWHTTCFSDGDPKSWEELVVMADLPKETKFISLRVGVEEDRENDIEPSAVEFDGHFVDKVDLKLIIPARHSLND